MKAFMFVFPVIFILFAAFFAFVSYSVLFKKKPVIISSKWLMVLMGAGFLPSIINNLYEYFSSDNGSIMQLLVSLMFILVLVFYAFVMKGVSIYGITDEDFRTYLFRTLTKKGIIFSEKINKIHLDDLNTDINISFQEWMGTGMLRIKDKKKFDFANFILEFRVTINENKVSTKKATAYFYSVFALLMIAVTVAFIVILTTV